MVCEKCGKLHNGTFGSGRFCSRSCANKHKHSKETINRIKNSVRKTYKNKLSDHKLSDDLDTRICVICNKEFKIKHKYTRQTCSTKCKGILITKIKKQHGTLKVSGGYRQNANRRYGGFYKGMWCDSRWELAFLIYCLDNKINIIKCNEYFEYILNNKTHRYYPDFKINNVYYEIKGRWRQNLNNKLNSVRAKGFEIKLVVKEDMKPYLEYCYKKYKIKNLEVLYDK